MLETIFRAREIRVFEYTAIHVNSPNVVDEHSKFTYKINEIILVGRTHNPLVVGSSPTGPTNLRSSSFGWQASQLLNQTVKAISYSNKLINYNFLFTNVKSPII